MVKLPSLGAVPTYEDPGPTTASPTLNVVTRDLSRAERSKMVSGYLHFSFTEDKSLLVCLGVILSVPYL